ncbi:MAG: isochorismatase family protein [bacterium]|nr:isochorismatase family protein [bacterium]
MMAIPKVSRKVFRRKCGVLWQDYDHKCRQVVRIDRKTDAFGVIDATCTFMPEHRSRGRIIPAGGLPVPFGHHIISTIRRTADFFDELFAAEDEHVLGSISLASSYVGLDPIKTVLTPKFVRTWTEKKHRIAPHALFDLAWLKKVYLRRAKYQTLWTDHGIGKEARIHPELRHLPFFYTIVKGLDPLFDSYSAVRDNFERSTGLSGKLHRRGIKRVFLVGLALDYCVGYTALGLVDEGFEVYIIRDGTRSVSRKSELEMLRKLRKAGVYIVNSNQLRHAA